MFTDDFLEFKFNNIRSSSFNIVRVSGGNFFEKPLLPSQKEGTVSIPGGDGEYFFDSYYDPLTINIRFAFDSLTEIKLREMIQWLGTKQVHSLIFNELPFKVYMAKIVGEPQINYIPFDENDQRIYKGDGTLRFKAFYPYAKSLCKTLAEYRELDPFEEKNISSKVFDWTAASGLLDTHFKNLETNEELPPIWVLDYDVLSVGTDEIQLHNPGDIDSPLEIYQFSIKNAATGFQKIQYLIDNEIQQQIVLDLDLAKQYTGVRFQLNSKLRLILGWEEISNDNWVLTNNVYNNIIAAGDFIEILPYKAGENHTLKFSTLGIDLYKNLKDYHINYDYLYF